MTKSSTSTRVVLLAPFIHPYRVPLFEELGRRLSDLHILVSTVIGPDDPRPAGWDRLDVHVQRTLTLHRTWHHPGGFDEPFGIHIAYDTLWRLWRYRPDIVVTTEMGPRTIQAVLYGVIRPSCKIVIWAAVSEHNELGRGRAREILRRWLLKGADGVFVNGASGERYIRRLGVPIAKMHRVPYTAAIAPPAVVRPVHRDGHARRLLYVGQLVGRKGLVPFLDVLSDWAERHPDRSLELRLVGKGPLREQIEAMALPANVTLELLGAVPNHEIAEVFEQADIFAFPTLSDEWGVVINEAMTAGVPVLGSLHSQAVEELVVHGTHGWTFRPDDSQEIYDALDEALHAPRSQLEAMGRNGQEAIRRIGPTEIADRITAILRGM